MKTIRFITLVTLTITLIQLGCKKQGTTDLSGSYTVKAGGGTGIPKNRNLVTLVANKIEDSRCPANAICVWEGAAFGTFTFKDDHKEQAIDLCLSGCTVVAKPKIQNITLNNIDYTVELVSITPFPGTTSGNETTKATILIKRK